MYILLAVTEKDIRKFLANKMETHEQYQAHLRVQPYTEFGLELLLY